MAGQGNLTDTLSNPAWLGSISDPRRPWKSVLKLSASSPSNREKIHPHLAQVDPPGGWAAGPSHGHNGEESWWLGTGVCQAWALLLGTVCAGQPGGGSNQSSSDSGSEPVLLAQWSVTSSSTGKLQAGSHGRGWGQGPQGARGAALPPKSPSPSPLKILLYPCTVDSGKSGWSAGNSGNLTTLG